MPKQFENMSDDYLGPIKTVQLRIELDKTDSRPICSAPCQGRKPREFEKKEINEMLAIDVIDPAQTEWASSIVFVPNKDGALCFCVDYLKLNEVTTHNSYPIPCMDELIDAMIQYSRS